MGDIETLVRNIVRDEIAARPEASGDPELISVEQAATICDCGEAVIYSLVNNPDSGFPAVRLGAKTIKVDKRRLGVWFAGGGLEKC